MLFCRPLPDVGEGPGALHQEGPSVSEGAERGKCLLFHIDFACMSSCCMHVIMLHACHHAACMSSCCRHVIMLHACHHAAGMSSSVLSWLLL